MISLMKSAKISCVHPAMLQLFQKLAESMPSSGSEGGPAGDSVEEGRVSQTVLLAGGGRTAEMERGGEPVTLGGLEWSGEGGGPGELCCGTGLCSGLDSKKNSSVLSKFI